MAQRSYVWGGTSVGDAVLAPYSDVAWSNIWRKSRQTNRTSQGVIPTEDIPNPLVVTTPAALTVRIAPGVAMVDGKFYENDADVDFSVAAPGAGTNYYLIIIRKDFTGQLVRLDRLGPSAVATPTVTQVDGTVWDIPLAAVQVSAAAAITITDLRVPVRSPLSTVTKLGEYLLTATAASISFQNIPPLYRHLQILAEVRLPDALYSGLGRMRFNNDSGNNYHYVETTADPTNVSSSGAGPISYIPFQASAANALANAADALEIKIPNYRGALVKSAQVQAQTLRLGNNATAYMDMLDVRGWWTDTAAINRVDLLPFVGGTGFAAGSLFSLYGVN